MILKQVHRCKDGLNNLKRFIKLTHLWHNYSSENISLSLKRFKI